MNVNIEIRFPEKVQNFEEKVDLCVRQLLALENSASKASISESILILDSASIIRSAFEQLLGEDFVSAYEEAKK